MTLHFECVLPREEDAHTIMEWRNDPETLANSIHTKPKEWESFRMEFLNEYFLFPNLPPLFAVYEGRRVAFLRFRPVANPFGDIERSCCDLSINVAPSYRQKGIGQQILKEVQSWLYFRGVDDVLAEIKKGNQASLKAFEAAGFIFSDEIEKAIDKEKIALLRYKLALTPLKKQPLLVIAEAGSNWKAGSPEEDLARAFAMIEAAKEAGADVVKFQTFTAENTYVPNAGPSDYLSHAGIRQDIFSLFKEFTLPPALIPKLAEECKAQGIEFMSSVFSKEDFKAVDPYVKRHKIGSYEIGHLRLLELAGRSGKPLILSTGGATEGEIAWAVETFKRNGGRDLTLMQCTARYPAPLNALHLRSIPWLKERFRCSVGLSDHSLDPLIAPVAAVALGARVLEKHFTLDKAFKGPDHAFAVLPSELKRLVKAVKEVEQTLGSSVKLIDPEEKELRAYAHRGIQALKAIKPGDLLKEGETIAILRPGKQPQGVHPMYLLEIEGKTAKRAIALGHGIQQGDW